MSWFGGDRDAEIREEIEHHLAARAERGERQRFGSQLAAQEATRAVWRRIWLDAIVRDAAYALRGFRRSPGFFFAATATLALGIGAATAVFSVVDPLLFRPLPYPQSDRLVSIGVVAPFMAPHDWLFWGIYRPLRTADLGLSGITSWSGVIDCDLSGAEPLRLGCASAEASFLSTLRITPSLGRGFTKEEDLPNARRVALISHRLWQSRFNATPNVLGTQIQIDGTSTEIVGVLPAATELPNLDQFDLLLPQARAPVGQNNTIVRAIGRLAEGSSIERVTAAVAPFYQQFLTTVPRDVISTLKPRLRIQTLRDQQTRDSRAASTILLGGVLCLLAIAFSNVANLMLARSAARHQDGVLRVHLGASPLRLVCESVTEGLILTLSGAFVGIGLAWILLKVFQQLAPVAMPRMQQASLDLRVLATAAAVAVAGGAIIGLLSRWKAARFPTLVSGRRVVRTSLLRPALLVAQIAASCVLVAGATLLLRTAWNLGAINTGMSAERVTTASFVLNAKTYGRNDTLLAFFERLEGELKSIPGIASYAITDTIPPAGDPRSRPFVSLAHPGGLSSEPGMDGVVFWRYITPGYFATLGIPILEGRGFEEADRQQGSAVIFSRALAARLFGNSSALGRGFRLGTETTVNVIGVVGDVKNEGLRDAVTPEMYFVRGHEPTGVFLNQRPPFGWRKATVLVRSTADPAYLIPTLRRRFARLEPQLPVAFGSVQSEINRQLAHPRFSAALLSLFALIGPALACIGLYGVLSFLVAQRTHEIGVRMALGAQARDIRWQIQCQAARWTLFGVAAGLAGTIAVGRVIQGMLFNISPNDPLSLIGAVIALALVAGTAAWVPSYRASRISPAVALRGD